MGRWLGVDPFLSKYPSVSPFVFSLNTPIGAYGSDGKRVYFVAGNDQDYWNYKNRWSGAFHPSGIKFQNLDASHGTVGDISFVLNFRNSMQRKTVDGSIVRAIDDKQVQSAVNEIIEDISKNSKLEKNEQLNLAGYSYGAVLQSYVAIALTEKGYKVDNLILVGNPTSENSELMTKLNELKKQGKIGEIKNEAIEGDKLSNPRTNKIFHEGVKESKPKIIGGQGDDAHHFDLARPGVEADRKIVGLAQKMKKEGVK